jgi:hypothetical protein
LWLLLWFLPGSALALAAPPEPAQKPVAAPEKVEKPSVQVSFERQSVRENDSIAAHIWLSNDSNQTLTSVKLHIAAPDFVSWHDEQGVRLNGPMELDPLQPNQILTRTVWLKTGPKIVVGDFNALFTVEYIWQEQSQSGRSFVTLEKTLKANLFGSDTVAGVPLALASYIVPGLFFWMITAYFNVPWNIKNEPLANQLIYNFLASLVIVLLWNKLSFPDVNSGVSLRELSIYAGLGFAGGMVISGGYAFWRHIREQRNQRDTILATDSEDVMLEKLLRQLPARPHPKTTVRLADGREFIGSLAASTDNLTALVGWFEISSENIPEADKQMFTDLAEAGRLLELLQLARARQVPLDPLEPIHEVNDGTDQASGDQSRTWPEGRQSARLTADTGDWEVIEIR